MNRYWIVLALGVVWLQLFKELHTDWSLNPQYAYGYLVPFLALGLGWRRWLDRPQSVEAKSNWLLLIPCGLLWLLPLRLIEEANPEWRMVLWAHALLAVGATLCLCAWLGGRAWVKHFAFPVALAAVAVPWPMFLEKLLIHGLMRLVAAVVVELAGMTGLPAAQHGNLIEISQGLVGVDEACSGVRSLQTTFMTALFFGELYRLSAGRRFLLVVTGAGLAFLANIGRTYYLVWTAVHYGFEELHRVHDGAGAVVMTIILPLLLLAALWLRKKGALTSTRTLAPVMRLAPAKICLAIVGIVVGSELLTEWWYASHEGRERANNAQWSINWPTNQYDFAEVPISDTARAMLRCDQGRGVAWTDAQANQWQLFFLRWEPGRNSAQLAKGHTPEICLPSTGWKLTRDRGLVKLNVGGLFLPFRHYEFTCGSRTMFVFYCLWENRPIARQLALPEDGTLTSRWLAVRYGIRHLGQQVLELALEGPSTPAQSDAVLREELPRIIRF